MHRVLTSKAFGAAAAVGLALCVASAVISQPLTAPPAATVEMADMTWIEVRDALKRGVTTVLVPSGGIEASGPHMALGDQPGRQLHDMLVLAERHGAMLVAPVINLVPQGAYKPPTGNMTLPGTIGVTPAVFEQMLEGVALSLKTAGFRRIVFMADHGGSQAPQAAAAARLDKLFAADGVRVVALGDYYSKGDEAQRRILLARGETLSSIGDHAGLQDTAELLAAHAAGVRLERLSALPRLERDGSSGAPARATPELGRDLIEAKVEAALAQLSAAY
jgi:creatinine amidohydrolase